MVVAQPLEVRECSQRLGRLPATYSREYQTSGSGGPSWRSVIAWSQSERRALMMPSPLRTIATPNAHTVLAELEVTLLGGVRHSARFQDVQHRCLVPWDSASLSLSINQVSAQPKIPGFAQQPPQLPGRSD